MVLFNIIFIITFGYITLDAMIHPQVWIHCSWREEQGGPVYPDKIKCLSWKIFKSKVTIYDIWKFFSE